LLHAPWGSTGHKITFYRRLSTISADIKERIAIMASLFVKEKLVDPYIIAIDSTLLKAKGHRKCSSTEASAGVAGKNSSLTSTTTV
jgi:hypothetical protein